MDHHHPPEEAGGPTSLGRRRLEFAIGRRWNTNDTTRVLRIMYDAILRSPDYNLTTTRQYGLRDVTRDHLIADHVLPAEWRNDRLMIDLVSIEIFQLVIVHLFLTDNGARAFIGLLIQERERLLHRFLPSRYNQGRGGLSEETVTAYLASISKVVSRGGGAAPEEEEEEEEEQVCVVCRDKLYETRICALGCGHEYHVDCIKPWLKQKNVCPLCRAKAFDRRP